MFLIVISIGNDWYPSDTFHKTYSTLPLQIQIGTRGNQFDRYVSGTEAISNLSPVSCNIG